MEFYKTMYYKLFAAMADATEALEEARPEKAKEILIAAQQAAEEGFLADQDNP